jgi:chromosomal replication initiation ATPase DnaA
MNITEIPNKDLHIAPAKMNLDNRLDKPSDPLPEPLPNSSFSMAICGSSGSGKTSLMSAIVTSKKKNGMRQSYIKLFSKIVICSPTLASFKSNIWGRIKNKYEKFDLQFLN